MVEPIALSITGMTCSHCGNSVLQCLKGSAGVIDARVDLNAGTALIWGENIDVAGISKSIEQLGYSVTTSENRTPDSPPKA